MDKVLNSQQLVLQEVAHSPHIGQRRKELHFEKGSDPLSSSDTQNYFYFVMEGKIKIYQVDLESAKEQTLYLLSRGDMFDVATLLDGQESYHLSEVLEEATLVQVPLQDVQQMILEDVKFRQYFYSYLAQQLRGMEELAVSLSFYDVYQRVIQLFARFTETKDGKNQLRVIDNLRHEDLASMVGSVRKVVNRSLQRLKADGIIEISRKKIHLKNFQKLIDKLNI